MVTTVGIGPPNSGVDGMNTTLARQQIPPTMFWLLRNYRLRGESWRKVKGTARLLAGARHAMSLKSDGAVGTYINVPYTDSDAINVTEFNLGTRWAIFVSYRPDALTDDIMVCSHSDDAAPPWRITHNSNGTITAIVNDNAPTQATMTTAASYSKTGSEITILLVRSGATTSLYVNDATAVTATTLSATLDTLVSLESMYLGSWAGRASGSSATFYEFRLLRDDDADKTWRKTQYPWSGRFGNPNLVLHMTFEDGSGTAVTDWSRTNHGNISLAGSWTWSAASPRKVVSPVTGIQTLTKPTGRKWLIVDQDRNHYRIPLN